MLQVDVRRLTLRRLRMQRLLRFSFFALITVATVTGILSVCGKANDSATSDVNSANSEIELTLVGGAE